LHVKYTQLFSYFDDWLDALTQHPGMSLTAHNLADGVDDSLKHIISDASYVFLHHSVLGDSNQFLANLVPALQSRKGVLLTFVGNELNMPCVSMVERLALLKQVAPEFILTQILQEGGDWLYQDCVNSKVLSVPHALNPKAFKPCKLHDVRGFDLAVMSAKYGVTVGDSDRNDLLSFFHDDAHGLCCDIRLSNDESKRMNRQQWARFLNDTKFTLATEAGSHFLSRDDVLINEVTGYIHSSQNKICVSSQSSLVNNLKYFIPKSYRFRLKSWLKPFVVMDHDDDESNDDKIVEILSQYYTDDKRCPVYSKAISSRHFDAIGCGTGLIMFPGRYNDILFANEHFVLIERDFSNIEDVLSFMSHKEKVKDMVDRCYSYVCQSHTHFHRMNDIIECLH
jgi:hypothetical protein